MLDLFSDDARRNPFPIYDQLRRTAPVLEIPNNDLWLVFEYESVRRVLSDHDSFSSSLAAAGRGNPEWLIFFDPPRHTKLRSLIGQAFTPRAIAGLEPRIRQISRELIDQHIERGAMDLARDYAVVLPTMVIAEILGIPSAAWPRFQIWSDTILKLSYDLQGGAAAREAVQDFARVTTEMRAALPALLEQQRAAPRTDLLAGLLNAEVDGQYLTEEDILGFFQLLIVAGQETTANLINNAVLCLLEHPDQLARLRSSPDLMPSAIEEVLRYRSPLQFAFRATKRAVDLKGGHIPAGKVVLALIGSANRDPACFPDPDRFDITRQPNPHIAFGSGIHACLGAPLSRLEARLALTDLLQRLPGLARANQEPWVPRQALHVHGPAQLPVRFQPGAKP